MWHITTPWLELVLRGVIVYVFVLFLMRLTGKRQVGQLAPTDLVLLMLLANAVQNSMTAGDNSLLAGCIVATILVSLSYTFAFLNSRYKWFDNFTEGTPVILIHNGHVYMQQLRSANVSLHDLHSAIRLNGCASIESVHIAVLEINGAISVIKRQT